MSPPRILNFFIIFFVTVGFIGIFFHGDTFARDSDSLKSKIQAVASMSDNEIDLAEMLFLISKDRNLSIGRETFFMIIDDIVQKISKSIGSFSDSRTKVEVLRKVIHQKLGFQYTDKVDASGLPVNFDELFFDGLLKTRKGYCMTLSLIYLIVGERLNLPLYGVALPNHFFVRYDSPDYKVNIETTQDGVIMSNNFYRKRFSAPVDDPFFMKSLGKKKTLGAYFSNIGTVYYRKNRVEKALFFLEQSVAINPNSLEARNNLGNIYSELKRYDQAIKQYEAALKSDPLNVATLFNLGIAWEDLGNSQKSIEAFLQAIQIDPFFAPAHGDLVKLFLRDKKYFKALLHLKVLARLNPGNIENLLAIADVFLKSDAPALALEKLELLKKRRPDDVKVQERMAEALYRLGQFERSIEYYRSVIEQNPSDLRNYIQLGWTYHRKGENDWALAWTRQGIVRNKGDGNLVRLAWMNMGLFSLLEKKYDDAKSWYRKALNKKELSVLNAMVNDIREAEKETASFKELIFFKGWLFFEAGQGDKAVIHFENYLKEAPQGSLVEESRQVLSTIKVLDVGQKSSAEVPSIREENMVLIPAGTFIMGSLDKQADERPMQKVYLDEFLIDRYEVSASQFAKFLNAKGNSNFFSMNKFGTIFFDKTYKARKAQENFPANNVSWAGAKAYCKWVGKHLPTEAEWEKAARGTDGRHFPWGDSPPEPQKARFLKHWEELKEQVMVPVDSMPGGISPYGLNHMAGNVKEWVDDWYDREYYGEPDHGKNPIGPLGGEFKVIKGGSWRDLPGFLYSSHRNNNEPGAGMEDYGFRCARRPKKKDSTSSHR